MIIFRNCQTVNKKFVDLHQGDKVVAIGANGRHYTGFVHEQTLMKWRRDTIKDANLKSNWFRVKKVNDVSYEHEEKVENDTKEQIMDLIKFHKDCANYYSGNKNKAKRHSRNAERLQNKLKRLSDDRQTDTKLK